MKTGKCKECNGTGEIEVQGADYNYICPICKGDGKLDWIEVIVGKKHKNVQVVLNSYFQKIAIQNTKKPIITTIQIKKEKQ